MKMYLILVTLSVGFMAHANDALGNLYQTVNIEGLYQQDGSSELFIAVKQLADGRYRESEACRQGKDANGTVLLNTIICFFNISDVMNFDEQRGAFIAERGLGRIGMNLDAQDPNVLETFDLFKTRRHKRVDSKQINVIYLDKSQQ